MRPMDKAGEKKLVESVHDVAGHVHDGLSPTDAVVKVAKDNNLSANYISLVSQAYNVGKTAATRQVDGGVLEKLAEFELADAHEAIDRVFGHDKKASDNVVSSEYDSRPVVCKQPMQKQASKPVKAAKPVTVDDRFKEVSKLKQANERLRAEASDARDKLLTTLGAVADFYKRASADTDFNEIGYYAVKMHGKAANSVLAYCDHRNGKSHCKAAYALPRALKPFDPASRPYNLITAAIKAGEAAIAATGKLMDSEKEMGSKEAVAWMHSISTYNPELFDGSPVLKGAEMKEEAKAASFFGSILGGAGAGMGAALGTGMRSNPALKTAPEMVDSAAKELNDPSHMNQLRQIRSRAMLNDFLANDEVISGYDPDEALLAYNELVNVSPSASTQPALMRTLLRKRLASGALDTFDVQQLAQFEKLQRPSGGGSTHV